MEGVYLFLFIFFLLVKLTFYYRIKNPHGE